MRRGSVVLPLLGVAAVLAAGYAVVRPTNFSGWDEWLVIDLTSRGVVGLPFENRPLSLLFNLPGSLLTPDGLAGFWIVHGLYLWTAAACVWWLVRRVVPERPRLSFLAAAIAATWAPLDRMRLDPVLLSNYSGATAATWLALVLLGEGFLRRRAWLVVVGGLLAVVAVRALESTAALVVAAPLLLWVLPRSASAASRTRFTLGWLALVAPALVVASRPLWPGQPASYQLSGLGFDPRPLPVLLRLGAQLRDQLLPLLNTPTAELLAVPVVVAAGSFAAVWALLAPGLADRADTGPTGAAPTDAAPTDAAPVRSVAARLLPLGLAALVLGHAVLVLSPSMRSPQRMQILSAPGAGLFLCGLCSLLAAVVPRVGWRLLLPLAGAAVVAMGTARTVAMQRDWDSRSFWPAQRATLAGLTRAAPGLAPGTLVLLVDEDGSWPASFTFRHAVDYLYGPSVTGAVWSAEPFLYPFRFGPDGILTVPEPSIQSAWHAPVTLHPYSAVVVVRAGVGGAAELVDSWPAALPALPGGAQYSPRMSIRQAPLRPQRAILETPPPLGGR